MVFRLKHDDREGNFYIRDDKINSVQELLSSNHSSDAGCYLKIDIWGSNILLPIDEIVIEIVEVD
jgi:hypothetical protein